RNRLVPSGPTRRSSGRAGGVMCRWFGSILVGLSVAATLFSGITFMAYPSVLYVGNIVVYVFTMLVCVPLSFVVLLWFLPRYLVRSEEHTSELQSRENLV